MFIVRHADGSTERQGGYEIPRIFNAVPAATVIAQQEAIEDDDYGYDDDVLEEVVVAPEPTTQDKTFSTEAFLTTSQDDPLPEDAIINEDALPKQKGKKRRR